MHTLETLFNEVRFNGTRQPAVSGKGQARGQIFLVDFMYNVIVLNPYIQIEKVKTVFARRLQSEVNVTVYRVKDFQNVIKQNLVFLERTKDGVVNKTLIHDATVLWKIGSGFE